MTTEQRKEKIFKKFKETCCYKEMESESVRYPSEVFDFFYSEIESREKEIKDLEASEDELCTKVRKEQEEAVRIYNQGEERDKIRLAELQRLEEIIKELKSKLPSGI